MAKKVVKKAVAKPAAVKSDASEGIGCAILAYLLMGIIWYFVDEKMKKNNFAKFHVKQALVLLAVSIIVSIALSIIGFILFWIPVLGWTLMVILGWIFRIVIFVLWLLGIINSATGKTKPLPIIGMWAEKLTF